jgi:hypothetical protein
MIILEGPDGAGKTTLLANLLDQFPGIQEHARASTSTGGPVDNIFEWAQQDVESWAKQPLSFYDRHPLISEPIYGAVLRGTYDPRFDRAGKVLNSKMTRNALVVICLPTLEMVTENVKAEAQLAGVEKSIAKLYGKYRDRLLAAHSLSPATTFHYDYSVEDDLDDLYVTVEGYYARWNRRMNGRIA